MKHLAIFSLIAILCTGCISGGKKQGNYDLTFTSMRKFQLTRGDLKNLQYFIKGKIVWEHTENNTEKKKNVDPTGAAVYQNVNRSYTKRVVLNESTPGVYKRYLRRKKDALLDVDFGNDIVIRFKLNEGTCIGDPKSYGKVKINGKEYVQNLDDSTDSIELSFSGHYLESNVSKTEEVVLQGKSVHGTPGKTPSGSVKVNASVKKR